MDSTTTQTAWWQIYLDNFFSAERGANLPHLIVTLLEQALHAWQETGVLVAAGKQLTGSDEATELGVRIGGKSGLLGASPERLLKTILATLYLLWKPNWNKREAQVVLGRWVFILQYRRAAMGNLSRSWETIELPWPGPQAIHRLQVELTQLLFLGPLLQTNLRAPYDDQVSCSDASERGGAAAVSVGLTWSGRSLSSSLRDNRREPISCPILVISCFNGIGGAFRVYDVLGIKVLGKISIEIDKCANRVCRSAWPDVEEFHDILSIDELQVRRWANQYARAAEIHVFAGFPCVHLSRVRAYRKNLEGEGSKLFWDFLKLLDIIQRVFSSTAKVKFCVENVASMDPAAKDAISEQLQVSPIKLDPCDSLPYNRPRFAWCSEELFEMEGLQLWTEQNHVRAYVTAEQVQPSQWVRPGWSFPGEGRIKLPTFMKAIPRQQPPCAPAGLHKCDDHT